MLVPKRVKHRKVQRGSMTVSYTHLNVQKPQLEAARAEPQGQQGPDAHRRLQGAHPDLSLIHI